MSTFVEKMMYGTAGDFKLVRNAKEEQQLRENGYVDSPDPGHIAARQEAAAPDESNVKTMPSKAEEDDEPGTKPRKRA